MAEKIRVLRLQDPAVALGNLASLPVPVEDWPTWRKTSVTSAIKVEGPFTVQTSEGPLTCEDGYLAVDMRGYPYPIATDEFKLIYREVMLGDTQKPTIGRIVRYRSRTTINEHEAKSAYYTAAVVCATRDSLWRDAVAAGHVRDLSSDMHVHLVVFSSGDASLGGNEGGTYQEFDVAYSDKDEDAGTWGWPPKS